MLLSLSSSGTGRQDDPLTRQPLFVVVVTGSRSRHSEPRGPTSERIVAKEAVFQVQTTAAAAPTEIIIALRGGIQDTNPCELRELIYLDSQVQREICMASF